MDLIKPARYGLASLKDTITWACTKFQTNKAMYFKPEEELEQQRFK